MQPAVLSTGRSFIYASKSKYIRSKNTEENHGNLGISITADAAGLFCGGFRRTKTPAASRLVFSLNGRDLVTLQEEC